MAVMDGVSLTALTVSEKVLLAVKAPSLTVTVMVAVPLWFAAGVTVTVRFAPLPPKAMFALGTSAVSDEPPLTVRLATGVSTSTMVLLGALLISPVLVL